MRGDEARVEQAFREFLATDGWEVGDPSPELSFLDVFAQRGDDRLYAEVKGRTAAIGTDVDTAYGQLLRRMPAFEDEKRPLRAGRARPSGIRLATGTRARARGTAH